MAEIYKYRKIIGQYTTFCLVEPDYNLLERDDPAMEGVLTAEFSYLSLKQVLTPSALGCTIVSTFEGAEQSWTSDDGINPNSLTFDIDITNS